MLPAIRSKAAAYPSTFREQDILGHLLQWRIKSTATARSKAIRFNKKTKTAAEQQRFVVKFITSTLGQMTQNR